MKTIFSKIFLPSVPNTKTPIRRISVLLPINGGTLTDLDEDRAYNVVDTNDYDSFQAATLEIHENGTVYVVWDRPTDVNANRVIIPVFV